MIYKTLEQAAIAGLTEAVRLSRASGEEWEYGGFVYLARKDRYAFTPPKTSQSSEKSGAEEIADLKKRLGIEIEPGSEETVKALQAAGVVAHFHTHPCKKGSVRASFSAADIAMSYIGLGFEREYLSDTCTGIVYRSPDLKPDELLRATLYSFAGIGGFTGFKGVPIGKVDL